MYLYTKQCKGTNSLAIGHQYTLISILHVKAVRRIIFDTMACVIGSLIEDSGFPSSAVTRAEV